MVLQGECMIPTKHGNFLDEGGEACCVCENDEAFIVCRGNLQVSFPKSISLPDGRSMEDLMHETLEMWTLLPMKDEVPPKNCQM